MKDIPNALCKITLRISQHTCFLWVFLYVKQVLQESAVKLLLRFCLYFCPYFLSAVFGGRSFFVLRALGHSGEAVLGKRWHLLPNTKNISRGYRQLLWRIFILDFHFPAVLMCEIHSFCVYSPWCCSVLAMWLGENCSLLLKNEGQFWTKTWGMT